MPHDVHTQIGEIGVKGSLGSQMDVFQSLLFDRGLSVLLAFVRSVIFGPIITGSLGEGLAR